MKHIFNLRMLLLLCMLNGVLINYSAYAQSADKDKKTTIRIRVSEDENGKVKDIEKEYKVNSMTEEEQKKFVDKVLDSLGTGSKSNQTVSITIDNGEEDNKTTSKKRRKVIMDHPDDREPLAFNWKEDWSDDFDFNSEKLRSHMRNFEREFKPKAKIMMKDMENFGDRMGEFWNKEVMKPSTVRDLNVYANNPDNGVINLRFHVQQKGDLSITVTDIKGKEVGKKEIKDFEGDFVGQVDLKKNTKGTVFVTVVQNDDGAVKRIVIP